MSLTSFSIIESTLREGEQFVNAFFTTAQKVRIATMLDALGVEYLELTSPVASPQSAKDLETIAGLGLKAKVLTHTRCHPDDVKAALKLGVDGVDVVIGTSSQLRKFSHGKSIDEIISIAKDVLPIIKEAGVEVRFSTEDSLRSDINDLVRVYEAVDAIGVHRVGIADTVGIGHPRQIYDLVSTVRKAVKCDIEFHGHNDTGCAIANSFTALEAGATHIDTSILGIGERNGITSLGGLLARMYALSPEQIRKKYRLHLLHDIDHMVAELVNIDVPFNNFVTGFCAFSHKAGIHAKAVLNDPSTYEALRPEDFGLTRYIHIAHRLTGWNAVKNRAEQLGLTLTDEQARTVANKIKTIADEQSLTLDQVDSILHHAAHSGTSEAKVVEGSALTAATP